MGFRLRAAFETINASQQLLTALAENDAKAAAESATEMVLNACRYGLTEDLLTGLKLRSKQALGGRKSANTKKERIRELHQTISSRAADLLNSGKPRHQIVSILSKRYHLSSRQIRRIIRSDKNGHLS